MHHLPPVSADMAKLKSVWDILGREDPFWAVVSLPERRGGRWTLNEFLATGESDVQRYQALLGRHGGTPERFHHVLDFGCGVGRLARVWARHADRVTGVDISAPMLERARHIAGDRPSVGFLLNQTGDLRCLGTAEFDLVFSHICLQHIPWPLVRGYLGEFARVCRSGGYVTFQLPARAASWEHAARWRRRLIDSMPLGFAKMWRRWRHGSSVVFDVFYTLPETVRAAASEAGLEFIHAEPSGDAGAGTEGFIYLFRKPGHPGSS